MGRRNGASTLRPRRQKVVTASRRRRPVAGNALVMVEVVPKVERLGVSRFRIRNCFRGGAAVGGLWRRGLGPVELRLDRLMWGRLTTGLVVGASGIGELPSLFGAPVALARGLCF